MSKEVKILVPSALAVTAALFVFSRFHESLLGLSTEEWSAWGSWVSGIGTLILTGFLVRNDLRRAHREDKKEQEETAAKWVHVQNKIHEMIVTDARAKIGAAFQANKDPILEFVNLIKLYKDRPDPVVDGLDIILNKIFVNGDFDRGKDDFLKRADALLPEKIPGWELRISK